MTLRFLKNIVAVACGLLSSLCVLPAWAESIDLSQSPLFLAQPVRPMMMLNMSNDHQLYFKAYDDYSDLTGDGVPNTTYTHEYEYYGYFDSDKCYVYRNERFEPEAWASESRYCDSVSDGWSGNFLNWATMTRVDAVRKILYGGLRQVDTSTNTVLERSLLPHDAHAFAKYYAGADLPRLTPYGVGEGGAGAITRGITICNVTPSDTRFSQNVSDPPKMRVARGNYSLWASNERWQCKWHSEANNMLSGFSAQPGSNGNIPAESGINAYDDNPTSGHRLDELNVRVQVCRPGFEEENCRSYPSGNTKPAGLLQEYGERGRILFGLMTGSYNRNKSGGVLRKNIGDLSNEIFTDTDGRFRTAPEGGSIIQTLNLLRIVGYDYDEGVYNTAVNTGGDGCQWGWNSFNDGVCTNWGNPQSEIFLESLRYLAGLNATPGFSVSGNDRISGLISATWSDPLNDRNYCAPLSVVQFNASTSSYDDDLGSAADIGLDDVDAWVDTVGDNENIHGGTFFVGEAGGSSDDQMCTPKRVDNLSDVRGTCPDAPRLEGSYGIAGLAHFARENSIRNDLLGDQSVRTYGVSLAPAVPQIEIPVPNSSRTVTILPACRNDGVGGNCAIIDFKVVEYDVSSSQVSGKLYVNWEDSEQGGDFDQDMWGVIDFVVGSTEVSVTTNVIAYSTSDSDQMGFGYVIGGTTSDGYFAHSGINGYNFTAPEAPAGADISGCNNCRVGDDPTTNIYLIGESPARQLDSPLYFAAKWGGYFEDESTVEQIREGEAETYFFATEPSQLLEDLDAAFRAVADEVGSASAVATNSTRLDTDTLVYQATFDSSDWTGELMAVEYDREDSFGEVRWSTSDTLTPGISNSRNIWTFNGAAGVEFRADNLTEQQASQLSGEEFDQTILENRVNWVRGVDVPGMRERDNVLGDIVNANPAYMSRQSSRFYGLSSDLGGPSYMEFVASRQGRRDVIFVNSNAGMLHAFDAQTGEEIFAYVPSTVYGKLYQMSLSNYGTPANPHRYSVDGQIYVGDAYVDGSWRTLLVGALGAGGKGVFVLDVTDPDSFGPQNVMFEVTDETHADVGNVLGQPYIVPTADGWYVVFGNGYNSNANRSSLIMAKLTGGELTARSIGATEGNGSVSDPNGLAGPGLLVRGSRLVTHAYAGDYHGNLWRFDLQSSDPGSWGYSLMFQARDRNGARQPITAEPTLGLNEQKGDAIMVYFGTGSYMTVDDNDDGSVIQSFYAITDIGELVTRGRLMQKEIVYQGLSQQDPEEGQAPRTIREISSNDDTSWWTANDGWYLDLIPPNTTAATGERVVSRAQLIFDRLIFPTLITSDDPCTYGGTGWLMELIAVGDKYTDHSVLGEDGMELDYAVMGLSSFVLDGDKGYFFLSDISGELSDVEGSVPDEAFGRQSWRQLR